MIIKNFRTSDLYEYIAVAADVMCDQFPLVGTISNLVDLFIKYVVFPIMERHMDKESLQSNKYYAHLKRKTLKACLYYMVPGLHFIVGICQFYRERQMAASKRRELVTRLVPLKIDESKEERNWDEFVASERIRIEKEIEREFPSPKVYSDKDEIIRLFKERPFRIDLKIEESLANDKEFITQLVRIDSDLISLAGETVIKDEDFIIELIDNSCLDYLDLPLQLRESRSFCLNLVKKINDSLFFMSWGSDVDFVKECLAFNPDLIEFVRTDILEKLKSSEVLGLRSELVSSMEEESVIEAEIVDQPSKEAIEKTVDIMPKLSQEMILDKLRTNPSFFKELSDDYKYDENFILLAIAQNENVLNFVAGCLLRNRKFMIKAINANVNSYKYYCGCIDVDDSLLIPWIQKNGLAIQLGTDEQRNNVDLAWLALEQNREVGKYLGAEPRTSHDFIIQVIKKYPEYWKYISKSLRQNIKISKKVLKANPEVYRYFPKAIKKKIPPTSIS